MANKLLLQSIVKFREGIKSGAAKVQDVVQDYFNKTGKTVTEEERALILSEFAKDAPSNVTPLKSRAFDEVDETAEGFDPDYMRGTSDTDKTAGELLAESEGVDIAETILPTRGPNVKKAGEMSDTPVTDDVEETLGVKLRGDESFGELMEKLKGSPNKTLQKAFDKANKEEGLASLFPRGRPGEIFDVDTSKRDDVADFIKKMRKEGIANKDIKGVFKEFGTDIEGGKRAATTLARAADMGADTKIKQELLSELDEMKFDRGPRFFQEEYMGYDNFRSAVENTKIRVNNAIADDLELMGVSDEVVTSIMGKARETANKPFYTSGEEFIDIIKDELEFNDITNYDLEFYKKYFRELESLMRKPEPRFEYGGVV